MTTCQPTHSRVLLFVAFVALAAGVLRVSIGAQQTQPCGRGPQAPELLILPLRGNVYLLHGAGANMTLSIRKEGVLLVDSGSGAAAEQVVAMVRELVRQVTASPAPVRPCVGLGCAGPAYPSYLATIACIMRLPGRLHITWQDPNTLKVDIDTGTQTRLFHFGQAQPPDAEQPSWQGYSRAEWEFSGGRGASAQPRWGQLKVVTTMLEDPQYLVQPWIRTSQFKKQANAAGWNPTPCSAG